VGWQRYYNVRLHCATGMLGCAHTSFCGSVTVLGCAWWFVDKSRTKSECAVEGMGAAKLWSACRGVCLWARSVVMMNVGDT
jgi:hypothetical protein